VALAACEGDATCEENVGAQVLDERARVTVADQSVSAELADDEVERERGWKKRACGREAILLVPEARGPLAVWGCDLVDPIDVFGLRDGAVVYTDSLAPCAPPCGDCPQVGADVPVDAVLEVPRGALDLAVGDPAEWTIDD
jgi:uncharacterized membrane protein (UPF0127 family)